MALIMSDTEIRAASSVSQITHLQGEAKKICLMALAEAYTKLTPAQAKRGLKHLFRHCDFIHNFKHSLAKGVAQTLAMHDRRIQAVYLFEPAAGPHIEGAESTIHLLVLVETPSAALDTFVLSLDRALRYWLKDMPSTPFSDCRLILDVNLVTDEELEHQTGLANLLSAFAPPLTLWERNQ